MWLFITTYKGSPIAGLQYFLEHHTLVLFESTQSYINQLELKKNSLMSIHGGKVTSSIWRIGFEPGNAWEISSVRPKGSNSSRRLSLINLATINRLILSYKFQIYGVIKQDRFQDCSKDWSLNRVIVIMVVNRGCYGYCIIQSLKNNNKGN